MLLDNAEIYEAVWNQVYEQLKFKPDCIHRAHTFEANVPFKIEGSYSVYGIEYMNDYDMDAMADIVSNIFIAVTSENERLYALDWQHSAFLYNPRNREEQKNIKVKNDNFLNGGYYANFPSFYPDGDYYFFIDENFRFGYLGHPWRQEIWIFGEELVQKFEEIYPLLGWIKLI